MGHGAPDQLQRLHAGLRQHAGAQRRHGAQMAEPPGHGVHHVARHQQVRQRLRAHGVRGHGLVAQPHHQRRVPRRQGRQQRAQLPGQTLCRPAGQLLLPGETGAQVDGDIPPHRAAYSPRPGGTGYPDAGDGTAAAQALPQLHAAVRGKKTASGGQLLRRFHRQIGA